MILEAVIDEHGGVSSIRVVVPGPEPMNRAAIRAVERWRYEPATLRGEAVAVFMNLTVSFGVR